MAAEARKAHDEPTGHALPMHGRGASSNGANRPKKGKETRTCYHCGKVGHLKANCPELKKAAADGAAGESPGRVFAVCGDSGHWGDVHSILFDTGASFHTCARAECFDKVSEPPIREVYSGGGEPHTVVGQGDVTIETVFGPVVLQGALCVPTLRANLCSWPAASSTGVAFTWLWDHSEHEKWRDAVPYSPRRWPADRGRRSEGYPSRCCLCCVSQRLASAAGPRQCCYSVLHVQAAGCPGP